MGCRLNIADFKKKFEKGMYAGLGQVGRTVRDEAIEMAPVDTGTLQESMGYKLGKKTVYIGNAVKYAQSQEFGTGIYNINGKGTMKVGGKPQPFLRPAINKHTGKIGQIVAMEIIKKLGGR